MIGGFDFTTHVPASVGSFRLILDLVRVMWPHSVFENVEDDGYQPLDHVLQLEDSFYSSEFFLYPNPEAYAAWTEDGGTEENQGKMLHVLMDRSGITLVADSPDSELGTYAKEIARNLEWAHLQELDEFSSALLATA